MNDRNPIIDMILGLAFFLLGGAFALSIFATNPCETITPPDGAEYAAKGDLPGQAPRGGYWIADGQIIGFAYAEDDPAKTLECFPEL
jgi:hypothetical protein